MEAAAGLADGDLRGEGDIDAVLVGQRADDPLGDEQLVSRSLEVGRQELDLVLFVHQSLLREVAHLRVAVLDLAARLGDVLHGAHAELGRLVEGRGLMVAPLVGRKEEILLRADDIELQFAHNVEIKTRHAAQLFVCTAQRLLGSHVEGLAVLGVVAAQDVERGDFAEGVAEGRAVARHNVEVARTRLDIGEEARTVHPLAAGEDALQVGLVVDDEIQGLQTPVRPRVTEIDHLDAVLLDITDQIGTREVAARLSEKAYERIGIQIGIHIVLEVLGSVFFQFEMQNLDKDTKN